MSSKIFFTDLDGTLLNSHDTVSEKNIAALKKLQDNGIITVVATGRTKFTSDYILELIKPDFFIGSNGAHIFNYNTSENIIKQILDKNTARKIYTILHDLDSFYLLSSHDGIYCTEKNLEIIDQSGIKSTFLKLFRPKIRIIDDIDTIQSIAFFTLTKDPDHDEVFRKRISCESGIYAAKTRKNGYDVLPAGLDKAKAMHELCTRLNIDIKDSVAIGDSENDITMLAAAGTAVAVGNAFDSVKEIADFIAPDNNNDAISYVTDKILENIT